MHEVATFWSLSLVLGLFESKRSGNPGHTTAANKGERNINSFSFLLE
jgi:hypothetical protein